MGNWHINPDSNRRVCKAYARTNRTMIAWYANERNIRQSFRDENIYGYNQERADRRGEIYFQTNRMIERRTVR
jgi:hypothetical protein